MSPSLPLSLSPSPHSPSFSSHFSLLPSSSINSIPTIFTYLPSFVPSLFTFSILLLAIIVMLSPLCFLSSFTLLSSTTPRPSLPFLPLFPTFNFRHPLGRHRQCRCHRQHHLSLLPPPPIPLPLFLFHFLVLYHSQHIPPPILLSHTLSLIIIVINTSIAIAFAINTNYVIGTVSTIGVVSFFSLLSFSLPYGPTLASFSTPLSLHHIHTTSNFLSSLSDLLFYHPLS